MSRKGCGKFRNCLFRRFFQPVFQVWLSAADLKERFHPARITASLIPAKSIPRAFRSWGCSTEPGGARRRRHIGAAAMRLRRYRRWRLKPAGQNMGPADGYFQMHKALMEQTPLIEAAATCRQRERKRNYSQKFQLGKLE